jgi:hypothetical protein
MESAVALCFRLVLASSLRRAASLMPFRRSACHFPPPTPNRSVTTDISMTSGNIMLWGAREIFEKVPKTACDFSGTLRPKIII